jgi:hypothetical protein
MTLAELYNALKSITGFSNKVVYRAWPVGEAPPLPFIVFLVEGSDNFGADNIVYKAINRVNVEFYSKNKDTVSEGLIEALFENLSIYWEKDETYLDDEQCYEIIYSIEV